VRYSKLQCVAVRCSVFQCVEASGFATRQSMGLLVDADGCSVFQCVATVCCSALQCITVRGLAALQSMGLLVDVDCCSVLQRFATVACSVLQQCVAVCCSEWMCHLLVNGLASSCIFCCSVLQCAVTVRYNMLQRVALPRPNQ